MASSSVLDLILRTRKQGTGAKEVQDELKGVKTVLGDLGLGVLTAGGAVLTLRAAFNETVGVAQQYDQVVSGISRALKINTEEASRVIQVSDDFGISQEALTTSLRFALKEGITPNIEGLARMSDQYLAITDTQERAAFGQKNLGKNWMEFTRMLEAGGPAIQAQAGKVESGLIVTDEAAKASERYRMALDGLADAVEAVKVKVGNEFIPVVTGFITAGDDANKIISQQEAILRAHAITAGNAAKETGFLAAAMTPATESTRIMNGEFDSLDPKLDNIRDGYNAVYAAIMAAGQAGLDAAAKFKSTTESMVAGVLASQEYKVGVDDVQLAIAALRDKNVIINVTTITEEITRQTWEWRNALAHAGGGGGSTHGTQMASGGDLPLYGDQLVELGELGFEYAYIHDGKVTIIPHSASRWMKEAGIVPGKGFALEQGGGNIASTGPTGGAATYGQYHVDQYLGTGGATFISNPLKGSTPGTWDWSQGWGGAVGGGGGGGGGAVAAVALAAQSSGQAMATAMLASMAFERRQQNEIAAAGSDAIVREIRALKDELYLTMRDAVQQSR